MCDEQTFNFADLNLDFLESTPPRPTERAPPAIRVLTPFKDATLLVTNPNRFKRNSKQQQLAHRIGNTDALVHEVRQQKSKGAKFQQQLQDFKQSAQEISKLYEEEKCKRIELQTKTRQLENKCADLDAELAHKTLQNDQLQAQCDEFKGPAEYRKLAVQYLRLSQKLGEEHMLHWHDQAFAEEISKYCQEQKLRVPQLKSPKKRARTTKSDKAVQCNLWERAVDPVETPPTPLPVVVSKKTFSQGTQCDCINMRTQATQYISTTTTRSTSTACNINQHNVGTHCPEQLQLPSVLDMLQEFCKWDKITPITPIPPPPPPPAPSQLLRKVSLRTIGTCTFLCNIQRHIDFMPLSAAIKHSNSRPPSRLQYDAERIKHEIGTPTQPTANNTYPSSPSSLNSFAQMSAFSSLQMSTFEELWQVFGHMLLGLLQNHNTNLTNTLSTAHNNQSNTPVNQQELQNWMRCLYDNMQQRHQTESAFETVEFTAPNVEVLHPHALKQSATKEKGTAPYPHEDVDIASEHQNVITNSAPVDAASVLGSNMTYIRLPSRTEESEVSAFKKPLSNKVKASEAVQSETESFVSTLVDKILYLFPTEEQSNKNRNAIKKLLKCGSKKKKTSKTRKSKEKVCHALKTDNDLDLPKEETIGLAVDSLTKLDSFMEQTAQEAENAIFIKPLAAESQQAEFHSACNLISGIPPIGESIEKERREHYIEEERIDEEEMLSQSFNVLPEQIRTQHELEYSLFGSETELEDEDPNKLSIADVDEITFYNPMKNFKNEMYICSKGTLTVDSVEIVNNSSTYSHTNLQSVEEYNGKNTVKAGHTQYPKNEQKSEAFENIQDIETEPCLKLNVHTKEENVDVAQIGIVISHELSSDDKQLTDEGYKEVVAINLVPGSTESADTSSDESQVTNENSIIVSSADNKVTNHLSKLEVSGGKIYEEVRSCVESFKTETDTEDQHASISALIDTQLLNDILLQSNTESVVNEILKMEDKYLDYGSGPKVALDVLPAPVDQTDNSSVSPIMPTQNRPNRYACKRKIDMIYTRPHQPCKRSERLRAKKLMFESVRTESAISPVELEKFIKKRPLATNSTPKIASTERKQLRLTKAESLENVVVVADASTAIAAAVGIGSNEMSLQIDLSYFRKCELSSTVNSTSQICNKATPEKIQPKASHKFDACQVQSIEDATSNKLAATQADVEHTKVLENQAVLATSKSNDMLEFPLCCDKSSHSTLQKDYVYIVSPASPAPTITEVESQPPTPRNIPLQLKSAANNWKRNSLLDRLIYCYSADQYKPPQAQFSNKQELQRKAINGSLHAQIKTYLKGAAAGRHDMETTAQLAQNLLRITDNCELIACAIVEQLSEMPRRELELACATEVVPPKCLSASHRLLSSVVLEMQQQRPKFTNQLVAKIENTLFNCQNADKLPLNVALNLTQFYLLITSNWLPCMQENPARLFIAKCLYYHQLKAIPMIYEVLCCFPTTLPHREDRSYDRADALITVIQHVLMCTTYDMDRHDLRTKELLSKLRFEYHFEPFKPDQFEVLKNLMDKLRAGKLMNIRYAFAIFCKQQHAAKVLADVVQAQLLPLANEYYPFALQSIDYDERVAALLTCISAVIKPFPLDTNVEPYLSIFTRFLHAVQRPCVQEAALLAILRLQRFGYVNCYNALLQFNPAYEMLEQTKAILKTFIHRRPLNFWKTLRTQTSPIGD